jgi:hypothetical protein
MTQTHFLDITSVFGGGGGGGGGRRAHAMR